MCFSLFSSQPSYYASAPLTLSPMRTWVHDTFAYRVSKKKPTNHHIICLHPCHLCMYILWPMILPPQPPLWNFYSNVLFSSFLVFTCNEGLSIGFFSYPYDFWHCWFCLPSLTPYFFYFAIISLANQAFSELFFISRLSSSPSHLDISMNGLIFCRFGYHVLITLNLVCSLGLS